MIITNIDLLKFKEAFVKWQKRFGLVNYKIDFKHEDLTKKVTKENEFGWEGIENIALHEAIHLVIERLSWLARERHVTEEEIYEEEESIVRRLQTVFEGESK